MKNLSQLHDESFENEKQKKKVKSVDVFIVIVSLWYQTLKNGLMMKMEIRQFVHIVE